MPDPVENAGGREGLYEALANHLDVSVNEMDTGALDRIPGMVLTGVVMSMDKNRAANVDDGMPSLAASQRHTEQSDEHHGQANEQHETADGSGSTESEMPSLIARDHL